METIKSLMSGTKRPLRNYSYSYSIQINKPLKPSILYHSFDGSVNDLVSFISKGWSISPSTFRHSERKESNIMSTSLIIVDIDNQEYIKGEKTYKEQLTIAQCLEIEFVKKYCFLYTTPSHKEGWDRYRVVLPLPTEISVSEYKEIVRHLNTLLNGAVDIAAVNPSTGFYGNTNAVFYNVENMEGLPYQWLDELQKISKEKETNQIEQQAKREALRENYDNTEVDNTFIPEVLTYISPEDYGDWQVVCRGLGTHFQWSVEGLEIFEEWSSHSPKYKKGECERVWKGYQRSTPSKVTTIGSIIFLAKQNGYAPKTQSIKSEVEYTADKAIKSRYIAESMSQINFQGKVLGVKSPKNTGKSYWLKEYLATQDKVILTGDRRFLLRTLSEENNCEYVESDDFSHTVNRIYTEHGKIAIVLDSSSKLDDINPTGAILVIDEAEQYLSSLLTAKTHISKVRGKVLKVLRDKLPLFDSIILCDADLTDETVNFFAEASNKDSLKVENQYIDSFKTGYTFTNQSAFHGQYTKSLENKENIFYVTDSCKQAKVMFRRAKKQGIKALLLTGDSLEEEPKLRKYVHDKGILIKEEGYQIVFASPVIQSGISIELGDYFDSIYGSFQGVVLPSICSQLLSRDRSNANRYIFCNPRGVRCTKEFNYEQIMKNEKFREETLVENVNYLRSLNLPTMAETIKSIVEIYEDGHVSCYLDFINLNKAKIMAKQNYQMFYYFDNLIKQLKKDGYKLVDGDDSTKVDMNIQEGIKEIDIEEATAIHEAPLVSESEKKLIESKEKKTTIEKAILAKYLLFSYLPEYKGDIDLDFIYLYFVKDKMKFLKGVQAYWYAHNKEKATQQDYKEFKYAVEQYEKDTLIWLGDLKPKSQYTTLWDKLNLSYYTTNKLLPLDMKEFKNLCNCNKSLLRVFGIKFTAKTYPAVIFRQVLDIFSLKLSSKTLAKGIREYSVTKIDIFDLVLDSIEHKMMIKNQH